MGAVVGLVAGIGALPLPGADAQALTGAHAARATSCNLSKDYQSLGATYVEKLTVSGVSCGSGTTLVKEFNACRQAHGGANGHCTSKIDGFSFSEKREAGSSTQYVAVVTARKGRDVVTFTFSENT